MKIQCVSKTERMEGQEVVADVTFQPYNQGNDGQVYAQGAQVGTPNTHQLQNAPQPQQPTVLLTGAFTLQIRDQEEANTYSVGEVYNVHVTAIEKQKVEAPVRAKNSDELKA